MNLTKTIAKTYLLIVLLASCQSGKEPQKTTNKSIYSTHPAEKWEDALISGNGKMGIMVFGQPENEQVIFNHEFLYEPIGSEAVEPPNIAKYLPKTRELLINGKYEEAIKFSVEMAKKEGFPKLLWTDPYHPALVMKIHQPQEGSIENYKRAVDFETGEISVSWNSNTNNFSRHAFVSRADNIIVQKLSSSAPIDCSIVLEMQGAEPKDWATRKEIPYGVSNLQQSAGPEWLTFRLDYNLNKRGYEVVTKVIKTKGDNLAKNDSISIKQAQEVLLISKIVPLEDFSQSQLETTKLAINSLGTNYKELLDKHAQIHSNIFNRLNFTIYPADAPRHSVEELINEQESNPDKINPEFLEAMFNMGRYALLSSSGDNPPNLMGIWNGAWRPAWSGDFTTDANINLQISSANIANMPEAIDSYMKMLERIAPDWETNAKNIYGCKGYLAGTRTSGRRGLHTHFNVPFPGHFWLAGAAWLLNPCYEYYQVSGDREFLTNRLLPMMEKTALFFEDFLVEKDQNGSLIFAPSYSPENSPANIDVQASVNATMDIAAAKEAIKNLINIYNELGIKPENKARLETLLKHFPPYLINEDGALKEWSTPDLEDNYNHRHVSHLYPVWPGLEINPEETPKLFEASKIAALKHGSGNESAHGLMHMALIGARLKQPELLYKNLRFMLSNKFIYKGLFTSHNPNLKIFNSDALCSLPTVINEALVFSRPGFIELLPAWGEQIKTGKITNILCRTQAIIKELEWDFEKGVITCTIQSKKAQDIQLMIRHYDTTWTIDDNTANNITKKGEPLTIPFAKNDTKTLKISINK
ncbi:glycosyl hydrolase family 95 catalytic domain-containing protein [Snuella lapsa]|uniref:Glycoside hydrolase N-terminal domain-containing protein n=1 Tax=Snuella lapsa TaxID=870481 RepID=A0ABP6Y265_9FLAO